MEDELREIFAMLSLGDKCNAEKVSKSWRILLRPVIWQQKLKKLKFIVKYSLQHRVYEGHFFTETEDGVHSNFDKSRGICHAFHHTTGVEVRGKWKHRTPMTWFHMNSVEDQFLAYASSSAITIPSFRFHDFLSSNFTLFGNMNELLYVSDVSGSAQIPQSNGQLVANVLHLCLEYENAQGIKITYKGTLPLEPDTYPEPIYQTRHINWKTCSIRVLY